MRKKRSSAKSAKSDKLPKKGRAPKKAIKRKSLARTTSETRIKELERIVADLEEREKLYKTVFEFANDQIVLLDTEGRVAEVNEAVKSIFGYTREDVIGTKYYDLSIFPPEVARELEENFDHDFMYREISPILEMELIGKNGHKIYAEITTRPVDRKGAVFGMVVVLRDVTDKKLAEMALSEHRDNLEALVEQRTRNLEEANTALKVLLRSREEDKIELEERMMINVTGLVFPFIEELKNTKLSSQQKRYVDILENNIKNFISPFLYKITSRYISLTPTELKVADLIKQGKRTKEIAESLKMSERTVEKHRYQIRKKIGIKDRKVSLATHLMSMK